uniref:Protein kinase domain-containing protein n=1 Tax=Chlamydomonas euryale TaxID=1486919 RepID=A0A7R9V3Y9_9CHLO|mmetsp:Transcript_18340/g.54712  ORF Transcript_18340/g.54712 Transcript_18340/m.54712 type:complete len:1152 (+) Transcript_18340:343-3798(+)
MGCFASREASTNCEVADVKQLRVEAKPLVDRAGASGLHSGVVSKSDKSGHGRNSTPGDGLQAGFIPQARTRSRDSPHVARSHPQANPETNVTERLVVDQIKDYVFVNEYMIIKDLGKGTHGSVKLVFNTEDKMLYAMKVLVRQHVKRTQIDSEHQMRARMRATTHKQGQPSTIDLSRASHAVSMPVPSSMSVSSPMALRMSLSAGPSRSCFACEEQMNHPALERAHRSFNKASQDIEVLFPPISENSELQSISCGVKVAVHEDASAGNNSAEPLTCIPHHDGLNGSNDKGSFTAALQGLPNPSSVAPSSSADDANRNPVSADVEGSKFSALRTEHLELDVMKGLDHPHVVKLFAAIVDQSSRQHSRKDRLLMIMEYVEGGSVMEGSLPTAKKPLPEYIAWQYFRDVIMGLDYLHFNSIVHGDIKPDNLLLTIDARVKITDFGSAHLCDTDDLLAWSTGTPAFMAPEMCHGKPYNGFCGDMWALGVCLYMFVFGCTPFAGQKSFQVYDAIQRAPLAFPTNKPISSELQHLLGSLLAKDPTQRCTMEQCLKHPWVTRNGRDPLLSSRDLALQRVFEVLNTKGLCGASAADVAPHGLQASASGRAAIGTDGTTSLLADEGAALRTLLPQAREVAFSDGEPIVPFGKPCAGLFLVLEGTCDVVRPRPDRKAVADADFADALDGDDTSSESSGSECGRDGDSGLVALAELGMARSCSSSPPLCAGACGAADGGAGLLVQPHLSPGNEVDLLPMVSNELPVVETLNHIWRRSTLSGATSLRVSSCGGNIDSPTGGSFSAGQSVLMEGARMHSLGRSRSRLSATHATAAAAVASPAQGVSTQAAPTSLLSELDRCSELEPVMSGLMLSSGDVAMARLARPQHMAGSADPARQDSKTACTAHAHRTRGMVSPFACSFKQAAAAESRSGLIPHPASGDAVGSALGKLSRTGGGGSGAHPDTSGSGDVGASSEPLLMLSKAVSGSMLGEPGRGSAGRLVSGNRMRRALERSASMHKRMYTLLAATRQHAERHPDGARLLSRRGPGALVGSITGVCVSADVSVVARGPVRALLITQDTVHEHAGNPLVRAALVRSASALLVQEALEHFVECEKDIHLDRRIRNTAARMLLDGSALRSGPLVHACSTAPICCDAGSTFGMFSR